MELRNCIKCQAIAEYALYWQIKWDEEHWLAGTLPSYFCEEHLPPKVTLGQPVKGDKWMPDETFDFLRVKAMGYHGKTIQRDDIVLYIDRFVTNDETIARDFGPNYLVKG